MFNDTQNKDIINNVIDKLKMNPITDIIPKTVKPDIQPVFEVNKRISNVVKRNAAINSTTGNVYTTPSNQDFYLTGVTLALFKDASSPSILTGINITVDGTTAKILAISGVTLVAQSETLSLSLSRPIKIDRNTTIQVTNGSATANICADATIFGFLEDAGNNLSV